MWTVTVIGQTLDQALVTALCQAWGGQEPQWLGVATAAEFAVTHLPDNQWDVWADLQDQAIDLVVQPAHGRRKQVLLADMDSTMIRQECIDELAAEAGVGARVADITMRAMNGELDFEAALDARVALLTGLDVAEIDKVLDARITLMPGGRALVQTMKAHGAYTALVSGGFTAFTGQVAADLGFDEHRANTLEVAEGKLTGRAGRPILGRAAKVQALEEICSARGLDEREILAVGDGANDLGMLERAGTGVALHAKPAVQEACAIRINHNDLTALLYLQGYTQDTFVT